MKSRTFFLLSVGIWLLCITTLLGIYLRKGKKPRAPEFLIKGAAIFRSLNDEEKTSVALYDTAILRLNDESFHLVGRGYEAEENDLLLNNKIALKKIEIRIADPVLLERRFMVSEAVRILNNAEKKCLQDRVATIVFKNGSYYLCFDSKKYAEYVLKYGVECKECEESAKAK